MGSAPGCVRRAFLCGEDRLTGRSFEHRRQWVEDRLHALAEIFGVAIWGYAVMSNHLHVVVEVVPRAAEKWSAEEVAARWLQLYSRQDQDAAKRAETLSGDEDRIAALRKRLCDLSWFMRCLSEPIVRAHRTSSEPRGRVQRTFLGSAFQVSDAARRDGGFVGDDIRRSQSRPRQDMRQHRGLGTHIRANAAADYRSRSGAGCQSIGTGFGLAWLRCPRAASQISDTKPSAFPTHRRGVLR